MNHLQLLLERRRARTERQRAKSRAVFYAIFVAALCSGLLAPSASLADGNGKDKPQTKPSPRVTSDVRGSAVTRDGQRLRVNVDLGNVIVRTQDSGKIDYTVHLEADGSAKNAKELLKTFIVASRPDSEGVLLRGVSTNKQAAGRL